MQLLGKYSIIIIMYFFLVHYYLNQVIVFVEAAFIFYTFARFFVENFIKFL